ncbi:MAG: FAD-binding oxidoreductase [Planctomycetota bacterium]|jgi:ferredoxin--NADP+ reductase|nr:FAD-binding oxidoreductase [Planctomycetota bacterium]
MARTPPLQARILNRQDLTDTLALFQIQTEEEIPDFLPGQFLTLGVEVPGDEKPIWRAYSIASPPHQKEYYELYIRRAVHPEPGALTSRLWGKKAGDQVLMRTPKGAFTVSHENVDGTPDHRRIIFLAGGTGIAPFVSELQHLQAQGCDRELVICHGASYMQDLGYRELFQKAAEENHITYIPAISRPDANENKGWDGFVGRVETLLAPSGEGTSHLESILGSTLSPENSVVHVCGFNGTIESTLKALEPFDFRTRKNPRENGAYELKFESYG